MKVVIECFGTYRNFGDKIEINLADGSQISDIRSSLLTALQKIDAGFSDEALLKRTRFATQTEILTDTDTLEDGMALAVIPPVSGG